MILTNIKVYDLDESIKASGYPVRTNLDEYDKNVTNKDLKRIFNLTQLSKTNNAHGQWLTGVRVAFDVKFSNKAWVEAERYRFFEFISSQSTMHCITNFDLKKQCNRYVDPRIIDIVQEKINEYNRLKQLNDLSMSENRNVALKHLYLEVLYNIPSGFELTARITTNYRCLLNIYNQRFNHRLPEWREFCDELLNLPYFKLLVDIYVLGKAASDIMLEYNEDENQINLFDMIDKEIKNE